MAKGREPLRNARPEPGSALPDSTAPAPVRTRRRTLLVLAIILYAAALFYFYLRYVPLVERYQACLLPILGLTVILTAARLEWGTLFFIFAFPLINNIPYFFGLFEPLPQAPAALILFLFFGLGFLLGQFTPRRPASPATPLARPVVLFSGLVLISAVIAFFRYANFFPIRSDGVYELVTNVYGVTVGGAVMSVVFNALSYLTGFAFFFILLKAGRSAGFSLKVGAVLLAGTLLSQIFGLYQRFQDAALGNHPISLKQGLINATLKDALSFGAYIGLSAPILVSLFLAFRGIRRWLAGLSLLLSVYLVWFTGSKSGLISLVIAVPLSFILTSRALRDSHSHRRMRWQLLVLILALMTVLAVAVFNEFVSREISTSRTYLRLKEIVPNVKERVNTLGKMAVAMVRDYPLSGVGIGGYVIELPNYAKARNTWVYDPQSAENYLLQAASELGLLGLAAILWIFWEIFRRMRSGFGRFPQTGRERYLWVGAAAGVVSFWLNSLSHSYIGSYEIIYVFWLLVGLLFMARPPAAETGSAAGAGRRPKLAAAAVFILYGASLLWSSTRSLSLESRTRRFDLKQDFGFYQKEKTDDGREFRWTGKSAGTAVKIDRPVIKIPLMASHPDIQPHPVVIRVFLVKEFFRQRELLGEIALDRTFWRTYEYAVPDEIGREAILLFKVSRTWNPLKTTGAPDPRNLGVAVGRIELEDGAQ